MKWNFTRARSTRIQYNFLYLCIWIFANSLWHTPSDEWMSGRLDKRTLADWMPHITFYGFVCSYGAAGVYLQQYISTYVYIFIKVRKWSDIIWRGSCLCKTRNAETIGDITNQVLIFRYSAAHFQYRIILSSAFIVWCSK